MNLSNHDYSPCTVAAGFGISSSQQPLNARCEQYVNMNAMMNGKHGVCVHEHAVNCRHGMSHHPKTTLVLPACFQVNQVKKPFSSEFFVYVSVTFNSIKQFIENEQFRFWRRFYMFHEKTPSKTGFTAIPIKTAVHRVCNLALCGRHRISHVFINTKICSIIRRLHQRRNTRISSMKNAKYFHAERPRKTAMNQDNTGTILNSHNSIASF